MTRNAQYTNHLANETSPYLLQHLHNPVDWYPWGAEALDRARREDKPILLSIGYSACHWCHVMAHESFEDPDTAAVMNERFVNIKVDREERPDLDKIYQTAHSLLTQRNGGWPLTVVLDPHTHVPFFAGTYFPPEPRHGLPAFTELCRHIADFYRDKRDELAQQNRSLVNFMRDMHRADGAAPARLNSMPLDLARQQLAGQFDKQHGGFGKAPKFPHPTSLERLLRHWAATGREDREALRMVTFTLDRMALGGIYDQLGGGFCRYSVDVRWMIPHFEKMLYDNGPLLSLYSEAFAATGKPLYRRVVAETAAWVQREMQSPDGGYYSSLDADSEGEEGRFYVWTQDELHALLNDDEYGVAAARFGFDRAANFEGRWNPHVYETLDAVADKTGFDPSRVESLLSNARRKLFEAREQRVRPGRDDKILVSWNALMIKGMAQAARVFDEAAYFDSASRALDFIRANMWSNGRLLATSKDGHAHLDAYLDDYVFLIDAILERLQYRWNGDELGFALQLAEVVLQHFADPEGGFWFTADDHEELIQRPKPLGDDAMPSGNAIAAKVFGRLGHLIGDSRYSEAAEGTLKAAWQHIEQGPYGHTGLLMALEEYLYPVETLVIRPGEQEAVWRQAIGNGYRARRQCFTIPDTADGLPGLLAERGPQDNGVAYLCKGVQCLPPFTDPDRLREQLDSRADN